MRDHVGVKGLQRGELARRTGCNLETVRYYEKIGLLPAPPRTPRGYRTYDEAHEHRLRFILRARELGFGIEEIRSLLGLVDGRGFTCAEVREMTLHHLADVRARISDLRKLERTLAETVAACSGAQVPDCPVIDTLAGQRGVRADARMLLRGAPSPTAPTRSSSRQ
jgi:MerR family mercuric resistance operon transcriptional regulator